MSNAAAQGKKLLIAGQSGAALVTGLLLILVLTLLSIGGLMSTAAELRISANDRSAKEVFYVSEAGVEEVRSRLQTAASSAPIYDLQPADPAWRAFIGTPDRAAAKGYQTSNSAHSRYASLSPAMDYVVTVAHKLNSAGQVLKWGDVNGDGIPEENTLAGRNIYVITSEGRTSSGAEKTVRAEVSSLPVITAPAALYTKFSTIIQGSSTHVRGEDHCGSADVPGVLTKAEVIQNGSPVITGVPFPIVDHSTQDIDIQYQINLFDRFVTDSYIVEGSTLTGMHWGTPVPGPSQQDPTSCSSQRIVRFKTNSSYVRLSGGTSGCGLLLVEGDLHISGGFQWYGVVLVTGAVAFSGGGEKNVTGAMMAGSNVSADTVGGNANIIYCSSAIRNQSESLPLTTLRWVELFS